MFGPGQLPLLREFPRSPSCRESFAGSIQGCDSPFVVMDLRRRRARAVVATRQGSARHLGARLAVMLVGTATVIVARHLLVDHAETQGLRSGWYRADREIRARATPTECDSHFGCTRWRGGRSGVAGGEANGDHSRDDELAHVRIPRRSRRTRANIDQTACNGKSQARGCSTKPAIHESLALTRSVERVAQWPFVDIRALP